jgi:P-type Ca2+ transporter type 2C
MRGTQDAPDHDGLTRPGQFQRQRAPTITIDTSATGLRENAVLNGDLLSSPDSLTPTQQSRSMESTEHTPLLSHRPRPTTPHNISPPNARGHDQSLDVPSLLAIPPTRSRGSSFDYHSVSSYAGDSVLSTPTTSVYGGSHRKSSEPVPFPLPGQGHASQLDPEGGHGLPAEDNPFAFSPAQLSELFNPKNIAAFCAVGGLDGLVLGLRTNGTSGLSLDETGLDGTVELDHAPEAAGPTSAGGGDASLGRVVHVVAATPIRHTRSEPYVDRKRIFGTSQLPERKGKNFLQIMWVTFNDKVLIILTIVAAISLILGLYQDFGQSSRYDGPKVRWVEGVTIIVAVSIVVIVGSLNDYQKEQQFRKLNRKVSNLP